MDLTCSQDDLRMISNTTLPENLDAESVRDWLGYQSEFSHQRFDEGVPIDQLVRERAEVFDALLKMLWQQHFADLPDLTLVATGGYGRGELHPHSDIDLMILSEHDLDESVAARVGDFWRFLWDLKLEIGHAVRTISDAVDAAVEDVTTATALFEARWLAGNRSLFGRLMDAIEPDQIWPGEAFFSAKIAEQANRYDQFGGTAYNLEPNLKEGPGGLRDIQMVTWVARRHYGVESLAGLVTVGFLEPGEADLLLEGQQRLWEIRWALHRIADRRENRLRFDLQKELAAAFGFESDEQNNLGVEKFMQSYYRVIQQVERLNERLLQAFSEDILADDSDDYHELDHEFVVRKGYLDLAKSDLFDTDPGAMLRLFHRLQEQPNLRGVRANAIRAVRRNLYQIDDAFRAKQTNQDAFMAILEDGTRVGEMLGRMHRYGILDRYLEIFGMVVGRMQFDLFHVYTVDEHTLAVLREMDAFANDDCELKLARRLFATISKPEILYLAGLFHDIAKGRGGDHSELGAEDAEVFCKAHGLPASETRAVVWLVRHHLLMSMTAQRHDISDPETVTLFAEQLGTLEYLDYLYLLTVADIRGTNPKLWNSWKATLLSDLHQLTRQAFQRGEENAFTREEWVEDTQRDALRRLIENGYTEERVRELWRDWPEEYFLRQAPIQVAWQTRALLDGGQEAGLWVGIRRKTRRGTSEVVVYAPNRDGTFANIVDVLGRHGLDIADARAFNTGDGYIIDSFQVHSTNGGPIEDNYSVESVRKSLTEALTQADFSEPEHRARRVPKRLQHFTRQPQILFKQAQHDPRTIMELRCSDRPGLLLVVATTLLDNQVRLHGARIATFGDLVEDYFFITDLNDQPLDESVQDQLEQALSERLLEGLPEPVRVHQD